MHNHTISYICRRNNLLY